MSDLECAGPVRTYVSSWNDEEVMPGSGRPVVHYQLALGVQPTDL